MNSEIDDELRLVATRAYNMYVADMYGPYADRLLPAAAIPSVLAFTANPICAGVTP